MGNLSASYSRKRKETGENIPRENMPITRVIVVASIVGIFATGKHERHVSKASHCGSKQQQRLCTAITLLLLLRATYTYCCCSSRTSRSW